MPPEYSVSSDSINESEWDAYVGAHPKATGYHLFGWRRVMERVFGHQPVYLTVRDEKGGIRGVLPLIFLSSRVFGRFLVSLPFVNYGGLLADESRFQAILLDQAIAQAGKLGAERIELRHQDGDDLCWAKKQHKVSMRLELPGDFNILWKTFSAKLRSQIRRAEKERMVFRVGGEDLLDSFYTVFSRNMRDLGTPVYSSKWFAEILRAFPTNTQIGVVYLNKEPVAAGFLYGFRQVLEIPWASSDRRYNRLAPNMLLYRSVLEYACREGYRVFDFGRSTPGAGTYKFKEQWGARPVQLNWHYWLSNGGPLPDLSPSNEKFCWAISLWQRLPLFVSQCLGPAIVRYIP